MPISLAAVLLSLSPQISLSLCLTLPPSFLISRHDLPVFISYKNLMIHIFDCNQLLAENCLQYL